jgi:hypothetical protein
MTDPRKSHKKTGYVISIALLLGGLLLLLAACGGGGGGGGSTGQEYDYSVNLTPEKTSVAPGGTVNLGLHYDAPASNAGITWKLTCAQADCGSVTAAGMYTAPAKVDAQMVVGISATSKDNPSKGYYVEIWITGKIVVKVMPNNLSGIHVNETQQFTATVNSPDTAVAWQVNGVAGGNSAVGTISSAGIYTAPATVPDPDTVTITAVAHVDSSASTSVLLEIWPAPQVTVSISPLDPSVNINATLQFTATVQNTADTAVQWQVNGIAGGNSTIGMISATGLFTAPSAVPSPAVETVTAVSHADSTKSASTHVAITNLQNGLLNGPYAFQISGPDSNGYMRAAIGSVAFDGLGGFNGILDLNYPAMPGAESALQFTGSYMINQDLRGYMTFNFSPALTFAFTVNAAGGDAKLVEYDARGTHYAGSMQKQTPADFTLAKVAGDYAFSLYGVTSTGEREAAAGRFHADGAGNISDAALDIKEGTEIAQSLSNLTGTASLTDTTHGRGTVTFVQSSTTLVHFSFYMTNSGDIFVLSTDPVPSDNPLLLGRVLSQTGGPFSNASLAGPAVFTQWGTSGGSNSCLMVGQWTSDPGTKMLNGNFASNCGGVVTVEPYAMFEYVNIAANGRGAAYNSNLPDLADVFYMVSKNKAFLLNSYRGQNWIGMVEPQTATNFDNSLFSGKYRIGPISMPPPGADISQGYLNAIGNGLFDGAEDVLGDGTVSLTFNGTYTVDSTGKTLVTFNAPETFHYIAYPVSADRFVGMSIESGDSKANLTSLDK